MAIGIPINEMPTSIPTRSQETFASIHEDDRLSEEEEEEDEDEENAIYEISDVPRTPEESLLNQVHLLQPHVLVENSRASRAALLFRCIRLVRFRKDFCRGVGSFGGVHEHSFLPFPQNFACMYLRDKRDVGMCFSDLMEILSCGSKSEASQTMTMGFIDPWRLVHTSIRLAFCSSRRRHETMIKLLQKRILVMAEGGLFSHLISAAGCLVFFPSSQSAQLP